jgi:hypothetical protein
MDTWVYKGIVKSLNTTTVELDVDIDVGFEYEMTVRVGLLGVDSIDEDAKGRAATWLLSNHGRPVVVEVHKGADGGYKAYVKAMEGPLAGLTLNDQISIPFPSLT